MPPWLEPTPQSGPAVARLFHRLLALVFLDAWISLARQVGVLIGSRGLLPFAPVADALRRQPIAWWQFPSLLRLGADDGTMHAAIALGIVVSVLALAGIVPRVVAAINCALYLSFVLAGRTFLAFQWDALIIECGALAIFLPRDRHARWIHIVFRLLLFKLYFESGLAKWNSPIHDWQDGSAMTYYYETAPLPTRLAWYAHHLPRAWHHFESWATLGLEPIVPFGIFGPRRVRLATAGVFTGFQILNAATANYGFFCYLATALHVFALDEQDVRRAWLTFLRRIPRTIRRVRRWRRRAMRPHAPMRFAGARATVAVVVGAAWIALSLFDGAENFSRSEATQRWLARWEGAYRHVAPFRLVNSYHLFAAITRTRYEAEFQIFDGRVWTAHAMIYKPGDVTLPPPFVAPHQPRVDFRLWFFGLEFDPERPDETPIPNYVRTLVDRICRDPTAVSSLFREGLPSHPLAVRIAFWDTHFTSRAERAATGAYWNRRWLGLAGAWLCP